MPYPPVHTARTEARAIGLRDRSQRTPEEHSRGDPADAPQDEQHPAKLARGRRGQSPR